MLLKAATGHSGRYSVYRAPGQRGGWIELMLIYKNTPLSNKHFNLLGHFVGLPVSSCPTLGPKIVPNIFLELLWHKFQAYQSFFVYTHCQVADSYVRILQITKKRRQ